MSHNKIRPVGRRRVVLALATPAALATATLLGAFPAQAVDGAGNCQEPSLYELPEAVGTLPEGTVLLQRHHCARCDASDAGRRHPNTARMSVYVGRNAGKRLSKLRNMPLISIFSVGVAGFEPTTSSSRTKRATKLRHTPIASHAQASITTPSRMNLVKNSRYPRVPRSHPRRGWPNRGDTVTDESG
jgi:hypothetical protein